MTPAVAERRAALVVGDTAAGAIRVHDSRQHAADAYDRTGERRDSLLLEPCTREARRDARHTGQPGRGPRTALGQRLTEPELRTQRHAQQSERTERAAEHALSEHVGG